MAKKPVKSKTKNKTAEKVGRPTLMTPQTICTLEEAFALGCSDLEACLMADISKTVLYNYQQNHPEFVERKEKLKETPIYKARKSVVDAIEKDPDLALKFLERRKKDEFSLRVESTGADGGPMDTKWTVEIVNANTKTE